MNTSVQPKPVRTFSRDNPCTKIDLFNCFYSSAKGEFVRRAVVETRGEIGENAPKYMLKKGFLTAYQRQFVDWLELTEAGRMWLIEGLAEVFRKHPDKFAELKDRAAVSGYLNELAPGIAPAKPASTVRRIARSRG